MLPRLRHVAPPCDAHKSSAGRGTAFSARLSHGKKCGNYPVAEPRCIASRALHRRPRFGVFFGADSDPSDARPNRRASRYQRTAQNRGRQHRRPDARRQRAERHPPHFHLRRDEALVPRVRDERHRLARAARRARRPEARASAHPLRHAAAGARLEQEAHEVVQGRGRHDGRLPPARQPRHLRRARAHGAGVLHARAADRRPGQLRLGRRRSARGRALHRSAAVEDRAVPARRSRQGHGRLQAELRRPAAGAVGAAGEVPQPAGQRRRRHRRRHGDEHSAAQPGRGHRRRAWRTSTTPRSPSTSCARSSRARTSRPAA